MGHRNDSRHNAVHTRVQAPAELTHDHRWAGNLRSAIQYSVLFLVLLLLIDWAAGSLTAVRAVLWTSLAVLLFLVLYPARVSVGEGWLATRRLLGRRQVRTDLLVSVHYLDGVSQRLCLRDPFGGPVEIDPQVLVDNPELWHRLAADAHRSAVAGTLTCGETALRRISERVDREIALTVFKVSALD